MSAAKKKYYYPTQQPKPRPAPAVIKTENLPDLDGVEHINISTKGKTELGRMLSHFSKTPFQHPIYGNFSSMEGFFQWIRSADRKDSLRSLVGKDAKDCGRDKANMIRIPGFKEKIIMANWFKIIQIPELMEMMRESTLPFAYYYIYGPEKIVIVPENYTWLVEGFERIRTHLKEQGPDVPFAYRRPRT